MRLERRNVMDDIFGRPEKRCACCGRWLERAEFNSQRSSADGLQSYCKACKKRYRMKHPMKEYKRGKKDDSLNIW